MVVDTINIFLVFVTTSDPLLCVYKCLICKFEIQHLFVQMFSKFSFFGAQIPCDTKVCPINAILSTYDPPHMGPITRPLY